MGYQRGTRERVSERKVKGTRNRASTRRSLTVVEALGPAGDPVLGTPLGVAPLLVHIGLHKTGSTWLQNHAFCDSDLGFASIDNAPRHRIVDHFVRPDPLFYDAPATAAFYAPYCAKACAEGLTLAISHERLSGYPASGGHDRTLIADRLRATFPTCRILIVLREQEALICSMYSQYVTDGGAVSLRRFLTTPEPRLGRKPYFSTELYEFDRLIEYYFGLFGRQNVLVLPFELLSVSPETFVHRI